MKARFFTATATWSALVAAALVAVPLSYRDRLPDPLATHWGPAGDPDAASSFDRFVLISVLTWAVMAGAGLVLVVRGRSLGRRVVRRRAGAGFGAAGAFAIGLQAIAVQANLDRAAWQDAGEVRWQIAAVLAAAIVAGAAGAWAASRGPGERPAGAVHDPGPGLRLEPGETAVWVSSVSASWAVVLAIVGLGAALTLVAGAFVGLPGRVWASAVPLAVVGIAGFAMSSIRVKVSPAGLAVAFGPLRWPTRKVSLRKIEKAWTEVRVPSEVGGWGIRGLPGGTTIMMRGGECLVVSYVAGGEFAVSVDDAAHGAALLNALVQGQVSA
jgi:hypothetical protein